MQLVLAHRPGEALPPVRELCTEESAALVQQFRDGLDASWLAGWLAHLVQLHLWIACDCRGTHEQPPLFFVRRGPRETCALARMPDRPPHARHCAFAAAPALADAADTPAALAALPQLLCRWFGAARLNVLFPWEAGDALSYQYEALREVSKSLNLVPGRRLYDFSRTHPQGLPALFRRLSRTAQEARSDVRSAGLFLTVASTLGNIELPQMLDGAELSCASGDGRVPAIERFCGTAADAGPFVMLIEFAAARHGAISVHRVFALPVYSRRLLVPVQSAQERRTLRVMLEVQGTLLNDHHRVISIRKTLPDAPIYERGIGFQVQLLGPTGRATVALDVLSVDVGLAHDEGISLDAAGDTVYHCVGPTEGPLTATDQRFKRQLMARLLEEAAARRVSARAPAPDSVAF